MRPANIPTRILLLTLVTCLLFVTTLFGTLDWVRKRMDDRANADSIRIITAQIEGDIEALANSAQDYANWDLAYDRVAAVDLQWLIENFGITAITGIIFDRLALVDGNFGSAFTWGRDGPEAPSAAYVPRNVIIAVREKLAALPIAMTQTVDFVAVVNGHAVLFNGSYVLPNAGTDISDLQREDLSIAIFGRTITDQTVQELGEDLILTDIRTSFESLPARPQFALIGANGTPAAYLSWEAPKPGTQLFKKLVPLLLLISAAFMLVSVAVSVTVRRIAERLVGQEAAASRAARTEPQTGLPNRLAYMEHVKSLEQTPVFGLAILFIDINGFKKINDTIGHAGGDAIVCELAVRLRELSDKHRFLARVGGDEFVFVITDPGHVADLAQSTATGVVHALKTELVVAGKCFDVTASQGIAIKDKPHLSMEELVRRADIAMYHAKRTGATEAQDYNEDIETMSREDRNIEKALRQGLECPEEFSVHYQPIVDAQSGAFVRAEALARWRSNTIGTIGPDRFIRVAETAGLIPALGRILIARVGDDLARHPGLRVSINISPLQLQTTNFVAELTHAFQSKGVSPTRIEIELTEGVIVENADLAGFRLELLHDVGFSTALDDFGTGFSSIGYLRNMPFDTLKIDRSFIDKDVICKRNFELIRSIIHLGHSFGQKVVCEGVETEEQAQQLRTIGCDLFQGYHFGKPMPLAELIASFPVVNASIAA